MSGFLGIGNNKQETEDRRAFTGATGNLNNVFNFALPQGESLSSAGGDYTKQLLSGNRTALETALGPERAAIQSSTDAARRNLATSGTARGGGTASTSQTIADTESAQINNSLLGLRADAATKASSEGAQLLGLGTSAAGEAGNLSAADYETQVKKAGELGSDLLSGISMGLGYLERKK